MRDNPVKTTLAEGGRAFGTMVFEFTSAGLPAILTAAGADYVLYDMEHSGISMAEMKLQLAHARGLGLVPIVRPPAKTYDSVARLLDLGAMGLMLPMVESRAEAEEIVAWTRYPTDGVRGAMFGGAHDDYAGGDIAEKIRMAHERTLVLAMIETAKGVENVDEIVGVPGIDAAHLGQFDLSLSLGIPGQTGHARIEAAIDQLLQACERQGKTPACMAPTVEIGRDWLRRGFRMVSYSYDIGLLTDRLQEGLTALRAVD